jgi:hypothetical protein
MPFTHFAKNNKFCPIFLAIFSSWGFSIILASHILQLAKANIVAECVCFCLIYFQSFLHAFDVIFLLKHEICHGPHL